MAFAVVELHLKECPTLFWVRTVGDRAAQPRSPPPPVAKKHALAEMEAKWRTGIPLGHVLRFVVADM
jgi:hypothetical protein